MVGQEIDILRFGLQVAFNIPASYVILGIIVVAACKLIKVNILARCRKDKGD